MKKKIAIIAGGDSGEYRISINSAGVVKNNLDKNKFDVYLIEIRKEGWNFIADDGKKSPVDKNDFSICLKDERIIFDAIFNAIHGTPGENGIIQGYFDMLDIPYTSCDVMTSALTFNKHYCNKVVDSCGFLVSKSLRLLKDDAINAENILTELNLPLFVKPNAGGSSVGMTKVLAANELDEAIQKAFCEDDEVLIEEFIAGREITCGVFEFKGRMMAFPITEIISKKEFFDYEAKYDPSLADEITPADIPEDVDTECKAISVDLYKKLNCKGVVRFDYIFNNDGVYFLEVNTVPGLSSESIVPKQAKVFGLSLTDLFGMMIENVLD